ncbi:MAG TPA: tetratricopeptide repeat protein [Vicinamibacterales bacterium]|nr:tetratricopeptide repeat protein [Vicinamibacterales bacterium]
MKRTERRHLKENEIGLLVQQVLDAYEAHKRAAILAGYALLAIVLLAGGYYYWQRTVNAHAEAKLAEATGVLNAPVAPPAAPTAAGKPAPPPPPGSYPSETARLEAALPMLKATADAYPSARAGIAARYQEAATLVSLGRPAEAIAAYREVMARAGEGLYGQMARLGLAEAEVTLGHYAQAIATFKAMSLRTGGDLPVDGILMQLGRTDVAAGKTADAVAAFKRIVDEFPDSPYAADAHQQLDTLQGRDS